MMKIVLIIILSLVLNSCSLEKRVVVTTRGYEQYRQSGMTDVQIKALQRSNAAQTDTLTICKFK